MESKKDSTEKKNSSRGGSLPLKQFFQIEAKSKCTAQ
jgi:hypothetical protein